MIEITFAPSELDYKAKKCLRCFYIHKKYRISSGSFPPPVFSSFDVCQTNYYKAKNCSDLTDQLPEGRFMAKDELPGKITSQGLKDNKNSGTNVDIKMTLTAPGCGMGDMIAGEVKQKIEGIPGTAEVAVELVWDPPWDRDMINESAKLQLGML